MDLPAIRFPEGVYSDVRVERVTKTSLSIRDGSMDNATSRTSTGAFLRVLRDGRWYYASTTDLGAISDQLAALAAAGGIPPDPNAVDPTERFEPHRAEVLRFGDDRVSDVPLADKIAHLEARFPLLDRPTIKTWIARYIDEYGVRRFLSSRGADVTKDHQIAGHAYHWTMAENGASFTESWQHGAERFADLEGSLDGMRERIEQSERFLREAQPVEAGDYPVILSPGAAGVFAHESFGHKSEADFMLGDPSMLEEWKLGKQVGTPILSIVDDGSLPGAGYVPYDDEGQPSHRTYLVKNGVLAGRLHSAPTAAALGEAATGNARALSYEYEPIVRMTTTYIEPGELTKDELFAGVQDGFYVQTFKHGSGMSTFTIAPSLAWRIRDGRIAEPARISVITGSVFETLGLIDGLSDEVEMYPTAFAGCGKFEQYPLSVGFGGPYVRVSRMRVA